MTKKFQTLSKSIENPYGSGGSSKKITAILEKLLSKKIDVKKKFIDFKLRQWELFL